MSDPAVAVVALVDDAAVGPVLVIGSLPPEGRDLDVLVRPDDERAIAARLEAAGLRRSGREWVAFEGCTAFGVELVPAERWGLPPAEVAALFADARPIAGYARLVRPAPHHQLLLLARIGLTEKRMRRLRAALEEDPDAWTRASELAPAWGVRLQDRPSDKLSQAVRRRLRRRVVVAISGLDGAGKSSQAAALAAALQRLGYEAEAVWVPLASNRAVEGVSSAARRMLRVVRRIPVASEAHRRAEAGESFVAGRRAGPVAHAWVTYVALANALAHRRLARRGRVAVFDRYVLDSHVRMRELWGGTFPLARLLLRTLSPRPVCAFLLDVAPETAFARKQDRWSLEALQRQAMTYRDEAAALGVVRLDGDRPREELCAEIAETVWRALRG
jgi:thymidylate kinase